MDILNNGTRQDEKIYKSYLGTKSDEMQKERSAEAKGVARPTAEQRARKRLLNVRFMGRFQSKIKEIRSEGRYIDEKSKTMYQPRKATKDRVRLERRLTEELRAQHHNEFVDSTDSMIAEGMKDARSQNFEKTKFNNAHDRFKTLNPDFQIKQDPAFFNHLQAFMGDDAEDNALLLQDYYVKAGQKEQTDRIAGFIDEVMAFNFSAAMLNRNWAKDNIRTFMDMHRKALAVVVLIDHAPETKKLISDEVYNVLLGKRKIARWIFSGICDGLEEHGVVFNLDTNTYAINAFTEADHKAILSDKKHDDQKKYLDEIRYLKDQEQRFLRSSDTKDFTEDLAIYNLRFEDYAAMTGRYNRGQVALSGGRLKIVNNGKFCQKKGTVSKTNYAIKKRFMQVVLEQLGDKDAKVYRPQLMTILHLYNDEITESMPLTREMIGRVLSEINMYHSRVERALAAAEGNEDYLEVTASQKISAIIGRGVMDNEGKEALRAQIRSLLASGKRLGVGSSSLSDHQMENIVNGNIELLRNNILSDILKLEDTIRNVNNNQVPHRQWLTNELVKKIAILEIRRLAEKTDDKAPAAQKQLSDLIFDKAFSVAGTDNLKNNLLSIVVPELSQGGNTGFFETLASRRGKYSARVYNSAEFKRKADEFAALLDRLNELYMVRTLYLTRRFSGFTVDFDHLRVIGKQIDDELNDPRKYDVLLRGLNGTRFKKGFDALKAKKASHFSFEETMQSLSGQMKGDRKKRSDFEPALPALEAAEIHGSLNDEEQAVYNGFTEGEKLITDMLLNKRKASTLSSRPGDDAAKAIVYLQECLSGCNDDSHMIISLPFGDTIMRLEHKRGGGLYLSGRNGQIMLPVTRRSILENLGTDITFRTTQYGAEKAYLVAAKMPQKSFGEKQKKLNACYSVLAAFTGKKTAFFNNLSLDKAQQMMKSIYDAKPAKKQEVIDGVIAQITAIDNVGVFTDQQSMQYLENIAGKADDPAPIELPPAEKRSFEPEEPKWPKDELLVKNLIADIVASGDTWDYDVQLQQEEKYNKDYDYKPEKKFTKGYRIKQAIKKNMEAALLVIKDNSIVDRTVEKMALPDMKADVQDGQGEQPSLKKLIAEDVKLIFRDKDYQELEKKKKKNEGGDDDEEKLRIPDNIYRDELRKFLDKKESDGSLNEVEDRIDLRVKQITSSMQHEIADSVDSTFAGGEVQQDIENLPDPYERNLTRKQQEERLSKRREEIEKRLEKEYRSNNGQGNFIKSVLKGYFVASGDRDKRIMVASMLRNSKPKRDLSKATEEEKKTYETKVKGNTLGGYLKGAGPLLQKMLQGLPEDGMPEAMKIALFDMKSNLTHIPDEIVRARFDALMARSNGEITSIVTERVLGAASVGQAYLCRLKGPNMPQEGKEVVIKLLRPEARNRMNFEKNVILKIADQSDPGGGMRATYEGQLSKIEEEFDLRIEEANAQAGDIYNNGYSDVRNVGLIPSLAATTNTMVLEKAPGTTVDRYMKDIASAREEAMKSFYTYDNDKKVITDPLTKRPVLKITNDNLSCVMKARKALEEQLHTLLIRQQIMTHLSEKWVTEGIFGSGFYHGDLHAGNILIDDEKATIIDYGNAIQLTEQQQLEITRLTAAAAVGNMEDFRDAFKALLENTSEEKWNEKKPLLEAEINKVFAVGAKELTGQMISLILMRAQAIGLEVPSSINSFSQSQMRIQNTVDSLNEEIRGIRKDIEELSALHIGKPKFDIALIAQYEGLAQGESNVVKKYLDMLTVDTKNIYKELRDPGNRTAFNKKWLETVADAGIRTELALKLSQFRTAQAGGNADLKELEDDIVELCIAGHRSGRSNSPIANRIKESLRSDDENTVKAIERELAPYFEDETVNGKELSDAYAAIRKAKADHEDALVIEQNISVFMDLYLSAAEIRLSSMMQEHDEHNVNVKSFFEVMSDVTSDHLTTSLKRLGAFKAIQYTRILNSRTLAQGERQKILAIKAKTDDEKRLERVRKKKAKDLPLNLTVQLSDQREKRARKDEVEEVLRQMDRDIETEARKNGIYYRNNKEERETREEKQALRDNKAETVWNVIHESYVAGRDFPENYRLFVERLENGLNADFEKMNAEKDPLRRHEIEMELYRVIAEQGRQYGGENYFISIMKGEAGEGGAFSDLDILPKKGRAGLMTVKNLHELKDIQGEGADEARAYVSKLLLLFSERLELGYHARHSKYLADFDREAERRLEARETAKVFYDMATKNRFDSPSGYSSWLKETGKKKSKKVPMLAKEYDSPEGTKAYVAKLAEMGWVVPGEQEILGQLHHAAVSGEIKGTDIDALKSFLADIMTYNLETKSARDKILDFIWKYVTKKAELDKGMDGGEKMDKLFAIGLRGRIDHVLQMTGGDLAYWRARAGKKQPDYSRRIQERGDLKARASQNKWTESHVYCAEEMYDALVGAYEARYNPKTSKEDIQRANRVIAALESTVNMLENDLLLDMEQHDRMFEKLGRVLKNSADEKGDHIIFRRGCYYISKILKNGLKYDDKFDIDFNKNKYKNDPEGFGRKIYKTYHKLKFDRHRDRRSKELPINERLARENYGKKGDFRSFYAYYAYLQETPRFSFGNDIKQKGDVFEKYGLDSELMNLIAEKFSKAGSKYVRTETEDLMILFVKHYSELAENQKQAFSVEEKSRLQQQLLNTAMDLLELDEGKNEYIEKYDIDGMGVLSKEEREDLIARIIKEKERLKGQ